MPEQILLVARYKVKPENMAAVLEGLRDMIEAVKAHEPGCLEFKVYRAKDDPERLLLYEVYADEAAIEAHSRTEHFKRIILGRVIPLLAHREREFFTVEMS